MFWKQRASCARSYLIWPVLVPFFLLACAAPVRAEERSSYLAFFRAKSLAWLVDSILEMPEIACVDGKTPGRLRGMLPTEFLALLARMRMVEIGMALDEQGSLRTVFSKNGQPARFVGDSRHSVNLFALLPESDVPSRTSPGEEANIPAPFPAFPAELENADIGGWIAPGMVARLLARALQEEAGLGVKRNTAACGRNCRRIGRLLTKAGGSATQIKEGEPVSVASMPVCPFGGRYLLEKVTASESKTIFQVRCDHAPPAAPPPIPDTPLGKMMGVVLEQIRTLPPLFVSYSAADGVLRAELPVSRTEPAYELPGPPWDPDYGSMLSWVPAERVKLPISAGFPGGIFIGIDPRKIVESDVPEGARSLADLDVQPGFILLGGATPFEGFSRGGGFMPNPVIGVFARANELLPALSALGPGMSGPRTSEEIEGVDVTSIVSDGARRPWEAPDAGLRIVEHDGITFLSFEKRFMRELLRSWNGESPLVTLPELHGEAKFVLVVRMDVFGYAVSGIVDEIAFDKERWQCREGIEEYRRKLGVKSRDEEVEMFSGPGSIPQELRDVCPAKGIMWHPERKRLMCAVHDVSSWRARQMAAAASSYRIPADRWLFVTLLRRDGKAVLEARIIKGTEAAK